jgi:DNA-binding CsgD family transcriptional regulator
MIPPADQPRQITETSRGSGSVGERNLRGLRMDLAPLVRAVEVLMSPLEWGSRDAWLDESRRLVRRVPGFSDLPARVTALGDLDALLGLPGDEPGWLEAALDSASAERPGAALPPLAAVPEHLLPVVSLRCALASGLATLHRLNALRRTLGQAFDEVDTGMAIFRSDGLAPVARNARWNELLDGEPQRDRLLEHVVRQAGRAAASTVALEGAPELELSGRYYRLVLSRAPAGTLLRDDAVLVLMDRESSALPTTQELRIGFGLRGREPQVALLAAEGLSNADIARRLSLSAHTIRHYLERVLDRLGLHSRKALALRLMAWNGERPQPPRTSPHHPGGTPHSTTPPGRYPARPHTAPAEGRKNSTPSV